MHMLILINKLSENNYRVVCHKCNEKMVCDRLYDTEDVVAYGYITTAVVEALRKQEFKIEVPEEKFCLEKFAEDNNLDYDFVDNKLLGTTCYLLKDY